MVCLDDASDSGQTIEWAWSVCGSLYTAAVKSPEPNTSSCVFDEMTFCLLGGHGIPFELALSASEKVETMRMMHPAWSQGSLFERLRSELSQPQFLPLRRSGELRKYRYPTRKAELLVRAREWMLSFPDLLSVLESQVSDQQRRQILCECPGVGLKTASWILRNLGLGDRLAILDIHVMRALAEVGKITQQQLPGDYEEIESIFLGWCADQGANAAAFDLFLWDWQRGALRI
jgi:N-glycosylase/DNA lyase